MADRISSEESEGLFNDFIDERLADLVEQAIADGELDRSAGTGAEIIVEMDDIQPPKLAYGDTGGGRGSGQGPGNEGGGQLTFGVPFERFMELAADKLRLPSLVKEGQGKIKEVSYEFKTFGPTGVILDRKRTFKRALRSSIAEGAYNPAEGRFDLTLKRSDRRYKQPQRIEKPRYRAVCFYVGDISYSTYGERLDLEKRLLSFVHHWLDFNYGVGNVEHRFFVHDMDAYEVSADDFYRVSNIGGTRAAMAFDLVGRVARNDYDPATTNLYLFYVGDGELMRQDATEIGDLIGEELALIMNLVSVIEVKPSAHSCLVNTINRRFAEDRKVRALAMHRKQDIVPTIRRLFRRAGTDR